jgi:hypothetical protein
MMQSNSERRSSPRVAVNYSVIYHYTPPYAPPTKMLNLSVEGAAVEALDPLPVGAKTSFVFVVDTRRVVDCQAQVISVQPLPDSRYRVGVRFTHLSEQGRELVSQIAQSSER